MHDTTKRLYEAAKSLKRIEGQSAVGRLLNQSPQVMKNWESRGVSEGGALGAQRTIGASATWVLFGEGPMALGGHVSSQVANSPPVAGPSLAQALGVVLGRLPGLSDYRAGQVLQALQAATKPEAPLEQIERDLLQWLAEPHQTDALPGKDRRAA